MMGVVSIGRNLLIRQVLLAGLVVALGAFAYSGVQNVQDAARSLTTADAQALAAATTNIRNAADAAAMQIIVATIFAAVLMLAVSVPNMQASICRPLKAMAASVERLASGDMDAPIEGEDRNDELGVIARGLAQLRTMATAQRASEVPAAEAAGDKRAAMAAERVEKFSQDLSRTVAQLSAMTKRVHEAAEDMIVAARHASEGSDQATGASSHAATDVSSVATASEQLLDSIEEISRQVVQSTSVVKSAVERAVETNAGMGRLSAAAQKVGDVVSLISRIAAQTNLLALNATIEAARAGEAGRGFAVVAQEVKTLATQTAKATQDITGQITEMQEATDQSVAAIDKIQSKISEVEHISTIIAAAVHEQGAATQEIARNVRSAAAGTSSMSGHIEAVVRSVNETTDSANAVSRLAHELEEIATGMNAMVERASKFARDFKAAA